MQALLKLIGAECSDSGGFFRFDLSALKRKPQKLLLKYKLIGFCPVQIGSVEVEKRNSNRSLHTKIFLDPF